MWSAGCYSGGPQPVSNGTEESPYYWVVVCRPICRFIRVPRLHQPSNIVSIMPTPRGRTECFLPFLQCPSSPILAHSGLLHKLNSHPARGVTVRFQGSPFPTRSRLFDGTAYPRLAAPPGKHLDPERCGKSTAKNRGSRPPVQLGNQDIAKEVPQTE